MKDFINTFNQLLRLYKTVNSISVGISMDISTRLEQYASMEFISVKGLNRERFELRSHFISMASFQQEDMLHSRDMPLYSWIPPFSPL